MALNSSMIQLGLTVQNAAAGGVGGLSNISMVHAAEAVLDSGFNDNNTFYDLVVELARVFTVAGGSLDVADWSSPAHAIYGVLTVSLGLKNDTTGLATPIRNTLEGLPHTTLPKADIIMSDALMGITVAIVTMRLWTKHHFVKKVSWDDWAILLCLVFVLIHGIILILTIKAGIGRHIWDASLEQVISNVKYSWICSIFYPAAICSIKASLLIFYLTLAPHNKLFQRCCMGLMYMILASVICCVITQIFYCVPLPIWENLLRAKCINTWAFYATFGAWNVATNLVILAVPMYLVWNLQLRMRDKLATMFLFALGGFVCVASILRLIRLKPMALQMDYTYNSGLCAFWTVLEMHVAVICACIPALRAFILRYAPQIIKSTLTKGGSRSSGRNSDRSERRLRKDTHQVMEMEEGRHHICEMKCDHDAHEAALTASKSLEANLSLEAKENAEEVV